jgi:hypothetical protein
MFVLGGSLHEAKKDGNIIVVFYRKLILLFQCVFSTIISVASLIVVF